jgi:hypothetical protein
MIYANMLQNIDIAAYFQIVNQASSPTVFSCEELRLASDTLVDLFTLLPKKLLG